MPGEKTSLLDALTLRPVLGCFVFGFAPMPRNFGTAGMLACPNRLTHRLRTGDTHTALGAVSERRGSRSADSPIPCPADSSWGILNSVTTTGGNNRPRPRFRRQTSPTSSAADPEALFGDLPRTPRGVGALWSHQADQLRAYAQDHLTSPDVALELPTGSGKTLVGLLISEWRRRSLGQRVVYTCPTKQLARQVLTKAQDQGISAVLLVGSHRDWNQAELSQYSRGEAIAISTYSSIFNVNSHLSDAQTLVFDDAHAAEGYVAEAWALSVYRDDDAYHRLFDAFGESLDPSFVARMLAADGPTADPNEVRLLPISAVSRRLTDIETVLAGLTGDPQWRFRMIREHLASCLFYVSRREFYIRPMTPPTFDHASFAAPAQRVYLSATLGDAGELERSFGRTGIKRVPVPAAWEKAGSGRRFFVFPELATSPPSESDEESEAAPSVTLAGKVLDLASKRLLLTPDNDAADVIATALNVPATERFTARDAETGIQPFLDATTGTLLAPSRYDGMDLADESCRMMLLAGLPKASHLQDRFLEGKLRASEVLRERIRTRVLQGAGRCTRGPKDWAVVVVVGADLLQFLSLSEIRKALPVELQAELSFGFEQSQAPEDDLVLLAESALEQDEIWQEDAEPELAKMRREATRVPLPNVAELGESAVREVRAWTFAWQQQWEEAARTAIEVVEQLSAPALRPYKAFWAYLGSAWSALAATGGNAAAIERSNALLRTAHLAAAGTTWLREVEPLPSEAVDAEPADEESVGRVVQLLRGPMRSPARWETRSSTMLANLNQKGAALYEQALVTLGELLGAESSRPSGQGRADAVWIWQDVWLTLEAKSEQQAEGMLSMDYVRQANTQLNSVAADRGVDEVPEGSLSVIVSPRSVVDPDAVPIASPNLFLVAPKLVLDIAHDVVRALRELRGVSSGVSEEALRPEVARILWAHRALPTQVRERLSHQAIRGA